MANILDYLNWRGDLTLAQSPFNPVDNLLLSTLSYAPLDHLVDRLEAKGAVRYEPGRARQYYPAVERSEAARAETKSFLSKVYGGSVGMMVSNLVDRGALSEQEIQELKAILDAAEKQEESSC